jgi:ubiquinone/menaquinone biosynthesis C-methylase UbiE
MTADHDPESWESAEYAALWAREDVIADLLEVPRQISVAIVEDSGIDVQHVVDLGSGPGAYLIPFLRAFPTARATWIDVSDAMRELAETELALWADRVTYVIGDVERLAEIDVDPAQVVISSRALHDLSPESLQGVYRAASDIVTPGGFVMNLDEVGAPGDWEQVHRRIRSRFSGERKREAKPHRQDDPLARTDEHGAWMEAAGFGPADTAWRAFYSALIVARKPA